MEIFGKTSLSADSQNSRVETVSLEFIKLAESDPYSINGFKNSRSRELKIGKSEEASSRLAFLDLGTLENDSELNELSPLARLLFLIRFCLDARPSD